MKKIDTSFERFESFTSRDEIKLMQFSNFLRIFWRLKIHFLQFKRKLNLSFELKKNHRKITFNSFAIVKRIQSFFKLFHHNLKLYNSIFLAFFKKI